MSGDSFVPVDDFNAPAEAQLLLNVIRKKYGLVPNLYRAMAHAPKVLQAVMDLSAAIQEDLPPRYRLLAYLRTSAINGCGYCLHYYRMMARGAGVSDAEIETVERGDAASLSPEEGAVVEFASQLASTTEVDAEAVSAVRKFLNEKQYVMLVATVGLASVTNRFNHACRVELP